MDYLVTGATGFVGNNLVRRLLERGQTVRVLVREGSDPRPIEGLTVERIVGDVCVKRDVDRAMVGIRCVIHAAANVNIGWRGLDTARKINVDATRYVATAAADSGAKMLLVSTVDALAAGSRKRWVDEESPYKCKVGCTYVLTKREAELLVLELSQNGLHAVIVNPGFMLGPFDWKPSSGRMLLNVGKRFTPFSPSGGMSGCDVRDVVDAIATASQVAPTGRRFILAGHNMKFWTAWRTFSRVAGTRGPISPFGPLIAKAVGAIGDLKTSLTGNETELNSAMLKMSRLNHYYSSERAKKELNYQIRPFEESVRDAWKWFCDNGYA
jgi:dihydroflavonol-4-reductase